MPRQNDLQELLQLAQLAQLVSGPQVQQQQLAQSGENARLQSALAILGLQQQAESGEAERSLRQQALEQSGEQFIADAGLRGRDLTFREGRATADDTFRAEDLDFRRVAAADESVDRARAREFQVNEQKDKMELGKRSLAGDLGEKLLGMPGVDPRLIEQAFTEYGPEYGKVFADARQKKTGTLDAAMMLQYNNSADPGMKEVAKSQMSPDALAKLATSGTPMVGDLSAPLPGNEAAFEEAAAIAWKDNAFKQRRAELDAQQQQAARLWLQEDQRSGAGKRRAAKFSPFSFLSQ